MAKDSTIKSLEKSQNSPPYREGNSGSASSSYTQLYDNPPSTQHHAFPQDVASLLGIAAHMVTPRMLESVGKLLDNQQILRELREQAEHRIEWLEHELDRHVVTNCLNRRGFLREIALFLRSTDVYGILVILQVHGIEATQEKFGFAATDKLIKTLAQRLSSVLRDSDLIGYLGQGNFAALLTAIDMDHGESKIDRLGDEILDPPLMWQNQPYPITIRAASHTLAAEDTVKSALMSVDYALRGLDTSTIDALEDGWEEGLFADLISPSR